MQSSEATQSPHNLQEKQLQNLFFILKFMIYKMCIYSFSIIEELSIIMLQNFRKSSPKVPKLNKSEVLPSLTKNKQNGLLPISQLLSNRELMSIPKFVILIRKIQSFNKNLQNLGQEGVIKFKIYEFLYHSLFYCKTKVRSELDFYLDTLEKQFQHFNRKRTIGVIKKKYLPDPFEQQTIRKTFKSNLPLEIDQFNRRNLQQEIKVKTEVKKGHESLKKQNSYSLTDFKIYGLELKEMRRNIEQRQKKIQFERNSKKNHSKIQSLTCKNFYKPMWNKNYIMRQKHSVHEKPQLFKTSIMFKKIQSMSHHCSQSEMNGDLQSEEIENIDGLGLIKNPFELHKKGKKDK